MHTFRYLYNCYMYLYVYLYARPSVTWRRPALRTAHNHTSRAPAAASTWARRARRRSGGAHLGGGGGPKDMSVKLAILSQTEKTLVRELESCHVYKKKFEVRVLRVPHVSTPSTPCEYSEYPM
jgi:hypothetical protein